MTEGQVTLADLMDELGFTPIYDLEQAEPDTSQVDDVMPRPCIDCAYRKNSRERTSTDGVKHNGAFLDAIVEKGEPFWCHDGMRQPVAWKRDDGLVLTREQIAEGTSLDLQVEVDYRPPIVGGIPYRADGRPADLCAGWAARRLKHVQRDVPAAGGNR